MDILCTATATTRPLTNSTICMLTVKISRPLRQLYFETSRPLSHHANWLPHVRVPGMGGYVSVHSVRTMLDAKPSIARPNV